jgi:hypothetical protein
MSTLVDELAYLIETPKDERPRISCLGGEWILTGRAMGGLSLCYDRRDLQFCWSGGWLVRDIGETTAIALFARPSGQLFDAHQKRNFRVPRARGETFSLYAMAHRGSRQSEWIPD